MKTLDNFRKSKSKIDIKTILKIILLVLVISFFVFWAISVGIGRMLHDNSVDISSIASLNIESVVMLEEGLKEFGDLSELHRRELGFPNSAREIDYSSFTRTILPENITTVYWFDISYNTVRSNGNFLFACPIRTLSDGNSTISRSVNFYILTNSNEAIDWIEKGIEGERRYHYPRRNHRTVQVDQRFINGFITYSNDNDTSISLSPIIFRSDERFWPTTFFHAEFYIRIGNVVFFGNIHTPADSRWDFQAIEESRKLQAYIVQTIFNLVDEL